MAPSPLDKQTVITEIAFILFGIGLVVVLGLLVIGFFDVLLWLTARFA